MGRIIEISDSKEPWIPPEECTANDLKDRNQGAVQGVINVSQGGVCLDNVAPFLPKWRYADVEFVVTGWKDLRSEDEKQWSNVLTAFLLATPEADEALRYLQEEMRIAAQSGETYEAWRKNCLGYHHRLLDDFEFALRAMQWIEEALAMRIIGAVMVFDEYLNREKWEKLYEARTPAELDTIVARIKQEGEKSKKEAEAEERKEWKQYLEDELLAERNYPDSSALRATEVLLESFRTLFLEALLTNVIAARKDIFARQQSIKLIS